MKILNFLMGSIASYIYTYLAIILSAFSFIKPSAFLFDNCAREAVGKASQSCRISNEVGLAIFDLMHYAIIAIFIIGLLLLLNSIKNKKRYKENLFIFSLGFIFTGLIFYMPESSFISILLFIFQSLLFIGLYYVLLIFGIKKSIS